MYQTKKDNKTVEVNTKEWFAIFDDQQQGPYSLLDLKRDKRFTPDTLVWKKGFQEWILARFVPEMKDLFKDEPESKPLHEPEKGTALEPDLGQGQATLTMQQDPYQLFLWILVLILVIVYTFYQLYK